MLIYFIKQSPKDANQIKHKLIKAGNFIIMFLRDFLKINSNEMYSTYNKEKSVVAEQFVSTLKNKIFKHMKAVTNNVILMF